MMLIFPGVIILKNQHEVRGEVTAIFLKRKDRTIIETLINTSDLETVKKYPYTWFAAYNQCTKSFYVRGKITCDGKRKNFHLHRWILDVADNLVVDHINHNTLDNTRENLRVVTASQNGQNRKPRETKSGVRGVSWHKHHQKWEVQMFLNGKKLHFGIFEDIDDAKKQAEKVYKKYMPFSN